MALVLFGLNVWIAWRLFSLDYSIHMGNVEGAFISLARYTRDHWPHLGWWPLWFCGMPYENTYQPLLPSAVAALSGFAGINAARAYHMVLGLAYSLGPVTLFGLAARLIGSLGWSFAAGIAYSLVSPAALLIPAVRNDLGSPFFAQRLWAAVRYADGPHVTALTLLPIAILFVDMALERFTVPRVLAAAAACAAVFLTNIPGAIALAMALGAYTIAYCGGLRAGVRLLCIVGAAAVLSACWVSSSTSITVLSNTRWMDPSSGLDGRRAALIGGLWAAAMLAGWGMKRVRITRATQFALLLLLITGAVVFGNVWAGWVIVSQPMRFHLVLEMAIVCTCAFTAAELRVRSRTPLMAGCAAAVILAAIQIGNYRTFARALLKPLGMEQSSEYKIARWLGQHAGQARVLVPGSVSFWLNAFTDVPQVTGCCDQGLLLRPVKIAYYVIGSDDGAGDRAADISITWLQALGARYVAVCGRNSTEAFRDIAHPEKFRGRLREMWREGDDAIYEVPQGAQGLAHVVRREELIAAVPENGVRVEPLLAYVAAIGSAARPSPEIAWRDPEHASIRARIAPDQVVSVQVPWHSGWRATVNGSPRPLTKDALGFMVIQPGCTGDCVATLEYDGGMEKPVVRGLAGMSVAVALLWHLRRRKSRPKGILSTR